MRNYFIRTLEALVELLVLLPVILLIGLFLIGEPFILLWVLGFFLLIILGVLFRIVFTSRKEGFYLLISILSTLIVTFFIVENVLQGVCTLIMGFPLTYRATKYGIKRRVELFPSSFLWVIGLPIYAVGYLVFRYTEALTDYLSYISWAGLLLLIITLFSANTEHLKAATLSRKTKPVLTKNLKRQNKLFIFITIVLALFLTNLQLIQSLLYQAAYQIISGIIWLLSLNEQQETVPEQQTEQQPPAFPTDEVGEPSLIAVWLERIMYVVVSIALVFLLILLIYLVFKRFRGFLSKGLAYITNLANQLLGNNSEEIDSQSYMDVKENLFDWESFKNKQKDRLVNGVSKIYKRQPNLKRMNDKMKVRYIYTQLLKEQVKQGYLYNPSLTPRETMMELQKLLPDYVRELNVLMEAYEHIKYGDKNQTIELDMNELITLIE